MLILAEVPGFTAADLKIEVRGTRMMISGTKSTALPEGPAASSSTAWSAGTAGSAARSTIFSPVNTHQGTARLADGLLTLEFPKIQDKRQEARVLHIEEAEETADE